MNQPVSRYCCWSGSVFRFATFGQSEVGKLEPGVLEWKGQSIEELSEGTLFSKNSLCVVCLLCSEGELGSFMVLNQVLNITV